MNPIPSTQASHAAPKLPTKIEDVFTWRLQIALYLSLLLPCMALFHFDENNRAPCTNVRNFGARGDGLTDDTDAIHRAFAAATTCVCFPPGVYLIDPDSTPSRRMDIIRSSMTVKGVRGKSALKIKDNSIVARSTSDGNRYEQLLLGNKFTGIANPTTNVTVQDLIFDCNYRGNELEVNKRENGTSGVFFNVVEVLRVKNCVFLNAPKVGLGLSICRKSEITDNYFYDVGQGKFNADAIQTNGCVDTQISGNVLENVGEGIFCQHFAGNPDDPNLQPVPSAEAMVYRNRISTLDSGQISAIKSYVHARTLAKIKAGSLMQYNKAGRAIGSSIGILSNNSKVYDNKIVQHLGISVQALKGHGDLSTTNVEVRDNTLIRSATIKYFDPQQGFIRNVNGALVVKAIGQTVSNVRMYKNTVDSPFHSGFDLIVGDGGDTNGPPIGTFPGVMNNITLERNTIRAACTDFPVNRQGAALNFRNANVTNPDARNRFQNITISRNFLGYARKFGLWLEPCMVNVKVVQNTLSGGPDSAGKVIARDGSCLQEINQPNTFTQAQLDCLLTPGGTCAGCTSNPANCPSNKKCAPCN